MNEGETYLLLWTEIYLAIASSIMRSSAWCPEIVCRAPERLPLPIRLILLQQRALVQRSTVVSVAVVSTALNQTSSGSHTTSGIYLYLHASISGALHVVATGARLIGWAACATFGKGLRMSLRIPPARVRCTCKCLADGVSGVATLAPGLDMRGL